MSAYVPRVLSDMHEGRVVKTEDEAQCVIVLLHDKLLSCMVY